MLKDRSAVSGWISSPILCTPDTLAREIISAVGGSKDAIDLYDWIDARYRPTPTIIEAAQALYRGHSVQEISHRESEESDIIATTSCIDRIIERSRADRKRSICFVTGVPGAGKTLVGLSIANSRHDFDAESEEHAIFLSGNDPLVKVLREALAIDRYNAQSDGENKKTKSFILKETESFIQIIHRFRDESLTADRRPPIDKIAIFDESQRAWTREKLSKFMREKKNVVDMDMSEPECLIEYMDRHEDYAVIICLVGGGQEIHDGEAGIGEWFSAIKRSFPHWRVYCSDKMAGDEYVEKEAIIDGDAKLARELYLKISERD